MESIRYFVEIYNPLPPKFGSSAGLVNPLACGQRWILEEGTSKTASFRQEKSHSGKSKADGHHDPPEPILLRGQSFQAVPIVSLICAADVILAKIRKGNGD